MLQAETEAVKPLFPPVEPISTATYRAALNSLVEYFLAVPYINRSRASVVRICDTSASEPAFIEISEGRPLNEL